MRFVLLHLDHRSDQLMKLLMKKKFRNAISVTYLLLSEPKGWFTNCVKNKTIFFYFDLQDTLQDYQEMFIQFGYVVLFSSAFPLAAMCALINNIVEIRSDALKLCTGLQRPFGQRVENIGQWQVRRSIQSNCLINNS